MLTFAIGDIHGCLDQLTDLLGQIERAAGGSPFRIVCLGDYIDRGPDSAAVVALLRERQTRDGIDRLICLKGNHEDMVLGLLARRRPLEVWLRNGGRETLASYGVRRVEDLPADVLAWFAACPTCYEDGRRCFVHAGLRPGLERASQADEDRMWIREEFLAAEHDFGRYVVHGHTPVRTGRPDIRPFRINLDTGAVYGGPLSAAMFTEKTDRPVGILQAG